MPSVKPNACSGPALVWASEQEENPNPFTTPGPISQNRVISVSVPVAYCGVPLHYVDRQGTQRVGYINVLAFKHIGDLRNYVCLIVNHPDHADLMHYTHVMGDLGQSNGFHEDAEDNAYNAEYVDGVLGEADGINEDIEYNSEDAEDNADNAEYVDGVLGEADGINEAIEYNSGDEDAQSNVAMLGEHIDEIELDDDLATAIDGLGIGDGNGAQPAFDGPEGDEAVGNVAQVAFDGPGDEMPVITYTDELQPLEHYLEQMQTDFETFASAVVNLYAHWA